MNVCVVITVSLRRAESISFLNVAISTTLLKLFKNRSLFAIYLFEDLSICRVSFCERLTANKVYFCKN